MLFREELTHEHDQLCFDALSLSAIYLCFFFMALVVIVVNALRFIAGVRMLCPVREVEFTCAEALVPSVLDEYMRMHASPAAESAAAAPKPSAHHGVLDEGGAAALQRRGCCAHVQRGGASTSWADVGATCAMRLEQLLCADYCKMLCCNADGRRAVAARTLLCLPAPGAPCMTMRACAQECKEGWFDADWRPSMMDEDDASTGKDPTTACCEAAGSRRGEADAPIEEPPAMSATRSV
jgi:hypothetical protein